MVRNLLLLTMLCLVSTVMVAQTSLTGKVTDEETGEPILYGTVSLSKDGSFVTGTDTDLDGFYNFPNIDPGTYDVEVSYVGYATARQTGIIVYGGQANKANIKHKPPVIPPAINTARIAFFCSICPETICHNPKIPKVGIVNCKITRMELTALNLLYIGKW